MIVETKIHACRQCESQHIVKNGKNACGNQQYLCRDCGALPYGIPDDNPFVNSDGLDEIYAYGLRNPWRWSFDKQTGELWLADVGQNQWEEINTIKSGGNYGWNVMDGFHCYQSKACQQTPYLSPIFEYSHNEEQSVTGGYVYRGQAITAL